ncbi:MAG TPA: hypothetical protein IAC14_04405 [Candidatus Scybalomonas excrementigallinarum]|nr:hypothetical protein [Candidatus Scybalomonas excrementigallinarum]
MFLFKKAKKRPILKSKARDEILKRLDSYLEENSQLPIEILHGFWKDQQQALTYQEIREWFETGDIDEDTWKAWQQDYSILVTQKLRDSIWQQAIVAGTVGQKIFSELEKRGFKVDLVSEKIKDYIKTKSTELITRVTLEQKEAIRTLLMQAINEGQAAEEFAKVIRPIVGLDKRQAVANIRYYNNVKATLKQEHPKMKAENAEKRARNAALKYSEKQHRYRAQRIAQTEMAFAYNFGADEAAAQAYQRGFLGQFKRIWCSAGGKEVCEDCQNLDGNEIKDEILPPKHPNCRCAVQYIEIEKRKELTLEEKGAIVRYIGPESYSLNAKLRDGLDLTDVEEAWKIELDNALNKVPLFQGNVIRTVRLEQEELESFLQKYLVGEIVHEKSYLSFSKGILYDDTAKVRLYIEGSKKGHDISLLNEMEQEILYERNMRFKVLDKQYVDNIWHILLEEE